jgi:hypothetical protein
MTTCDRTGLAKPECHCAACTAALIATHAPHVRSAGSAPGARPRVGQPAAAHGRGPDLVER